MKWRAERPVDATRPLRPPGPVGFDFSGLASDIPARWHTGPPTALLPAARAG
jgi:hypothetical protein